MYQIRTQSQTEINWIKSLQAQIANPTYTLVVVLQDNTRQNYGAESLDNAMIETVRNLFQSQPAIRTIEATRGGQTVLTFTHPCENELLAFETAQDDIAEELAAAHLSIALHKHGCRYMASQIVNWQRSMPIR